MLRFSAAEIVFPTFPTFCPVAGGSGQPLICHICSVDKLKGIGGHRYDITGMTKSMNLTTSFSRDFMTTDVSTTTTEAVHAGSVWLFRELVQWPSV